MDHLAVSFVDDGKIRLALPLLERAAADEDDPEAMLGSAQPCASRRHPVGPKREGGRSRPAPTRCPSCHTAVRGSATPDLGATVRLTVLLAFGTP